MNEDKRAQEHLASTVILLRTLRGLSQVELAARSGLSDVYIRQIERGERDVSIGSLEKLAKGLSCDPGELLRSDGRNAINRLIGEAFSAASEEQQLAIVSVLRSAEGERSESKKALLTLLAQEVGPLTAPVTPRRAGGSAKGAQGVTAPGEARAKKPSAKRTRKR